MAAKTCICYRKIQHQGPKAVTRRCSIRKMHLKISQNSRESTCVGTIFSIKLQASGLRFGHMCFPVNIVKFLRSPFYRTHSSGCLELYQKALVEFSCEKYKLFSQKILHHRCLRQS